MNTSALLTTNPGSTYAMPEEGVPVLGLVLLAAAVLSVAAALAIHKRAVRAGKGPMDLAGGSAVMMILFAVLSAASMAAVVSSAYSFHQAKTAAIDAHTDEVSDWLEEDYGIVSTRAATEELLQEETARALYAGHLATISVIELTNGDLAVVDESGAELEPLKR